MVRTKLITTVGLMTALLLSTGMAMAGANPLAIVTGEGGAAAEGAMSGGYYVDASGATQAAAQAHGDLQDQAESHWKATNAAYEETRNDAWETVDNAEPQVPQCDCEDQVFDQLDQASSIEASHTDSIAKAADLETDYVDAGADLEATGGVKAWFKDSVRGVQDAYDQVKGLFGFETQATDEVKGAAEQALHADDQLRGEVTNLVEQRQELPQVNPSLAGEAGASHATDVATSVVGQGTGSIGAGLP